MKNHPTFARVPFGRGGTFATVGTCAAATLFAMFTTCASAAPPFQDRLLPEQTVKVSEHVWAIIGFPNVGIIVGETATLVVVTLESWWWRNGAAAVAGRGSYKRRRVGVRRSGQDVDFRRRRAEQGWAEHFRRRWYGIELDCRRRCGRAARCSTCPAGPQSVKAAYAE